MTLRIVVIALFATAVVAVCADDEPATRLSSVTSIYVEGNNEAAQKIRADIRTDREKKKLCFDLATKKDGASAVLGITDDTVANTGEHADVLSRRHSRVSALLTLADGEQVWERSSSMSDAPFGMSGVKTAAGLIYKRLRKDVCVKR